MPPPPQRSPVPQPGASPPRPRRGHTGSRPAPGSSRPLPADTPPWTLAGHELLTALAAQTEGLGEDDAARRLALWGPNRLPEGPRPGLLALILRQLKSPLLYLLLSAGLIALVLGEVVDAAFIGVVIALDAAIGTVQEHAADRSAAALAALAPPHARVLRGGRPMTVNAATLVPGDIVVLEAGLRIPADLRLLSAQALTLDESLLTGESAPVTKDPAAPLPRETPLAERANMAFAGTLVATGRGQGLVVGTGVATELGQLARDVGTTAASRPPLLGRMQALARLISGVVLAVALVVGLLGLVRGLPPGQVLLACVALAVSAVPEGLPVGLTVALAIATRRMGRRHVIVRRLVAVEALGSCTWIASDKTGTLTLNQLAVRQLVVPRPGQPGDPWFDVLSIHEAAPAACRLLEAAVLCNEAQLGSGPEDRPVGDAVDVALLEAAMAAGCDPRGLTAASPELRGLPFDPARRLAASLRQTEDGPRWFLKGAPEAILSRCQDLRPEARAALEAICGRLAGDGFRLLLLAEQTAPAGGPKTDETSDFQAWLDDPSDLDGGGRGLALLGLVAMQDPVRPEAPAAVAACQAAGLNVAMVTGDHPGTALAIARELGLARSAEQVVTGADLVRAEAEGSLEATVRRARVFARVEPRQKTRIVETLAASGEFVAVTGDGANDAPALKAAHVGIAMGLRGTDVAREAASLVLTDDNFASIVAGIEEGRVAYANVRKVTFLLVTTGLTEVVLFIAAMAMDLPLPLLPVQLLWLNLVANGLQDVALAFEPAEGGELSRPPRRPDEPIFNRLMLSRVLLVAVPCGLLGATWLAASLDMGRPLDEARSGLLLGFVLLENALVGAARSERRSVLRLSPLRNPWLLAATLGALGLHLMATLVPTLADLLALTAITIPDVLTGLAGAVGAVLLLELQTALRRRSEVDHRHR